MLKTMKKITINGKSIIDNVEVCGYQAQMDELIAALEAETKDEEATN